MFALSTDTSIANLNYWLDEISHVSYTRTHTLHTPHTHYTLHTLSYSNILLAQNAPMKFQVILVATGLDEENSEERLDIAEQFAKERNLRLIKCVPTDPVSAESTFKAIIDTIMSSWEGSHTVVGVCTN